MSRVEDFFRDIDANWAGPEVARIRLRIIGSAALMLQTDYERGTKDSDVLETTELLEKTKARLLQLAGKGTDLFARHRMYVEIVNSGLPFLPHVPRWNQRPELNATLSHLEIAVLDVVDVVVSKLKRFNANDVSDIDAMIGKDLVPHALLIERFRSAVDVFSMDARADDLPQYVRNLHRVERDQFDVSETEIELPSWVSD